MAAVATTGLAVAPCGMGPNRSMSRRDEVEVLLLAQILTKLDASQTFNPTTILANNKDLVCIGEHNAKVRSANIVCTSGKTSDCASLMCYSPSQKEAIRLYLIFQILALL